MNRSWHTFLKTRALAPCAHEFSNEISASWNSKPSVFKTCNYAVLALTGDDAATFLQGQTTCDVLGLGPNQGTPGAICNPKGRVLTTFFLFPQEAGYRVLLPEKLAPAIEKRLRLYVLRSRVKIENLSDSLAIFGLSCDVLPKTIEHGNEGSGDERYPVLHAENRRFVKIGPKQWLFIGNPEAAERDWIDFISREGFAESGNEVWNLLSILNGIPSIQPETSEIFVPQMINLDALGGISFTKGCYTGQEIVARMHYLGTLKRRMVLAATRSERLPAPGEPVNLPGNDEAAGQVVGSAFAGKPEIRLLAVIRTEHAESTSLHLSDSIAPPLKILKLPYAI